MFEVVPQEGVFGDITAKVCGMLEGRTVDDDELMDLSICAPNIIEWATGLDYWNVPSIYDYWGQYQTLRDLLNLRCKLCNPQDRESIEVWDKPRSYLESENLLIWSEEYHDFVCPKCGNTLIEFIEDDVVEPYKDATLIVGMRGGKSYTGAHIGGYIEHFCITRGVRAKGDLQRYFGIEKSEWLESTFAASTATQAQDTIYAKYREMRNNSPWINKYVEWVKKKEKAQVTLGADRWSYKSPPEAIRDGYLQVRHNRVASDSAGVAGKTRLMSSIDELARLQNTEGSRSSKELYRVMGQSLQTIRSKVREHRLPYWLGLCFIATSPIELEDQAMTLYNKAKSGEVKNMYHIKKATWEYNPFITREDLQDRFDADPIGAERDFGANPPNAETPLVADPSRFWKSIDFERKSIAEFSDIHLSDPTGKDYVGKKVDYCEQDYQRNHYIFVDAGKTRDSFALAATRPAWINARPINLAVSSNNPARIQPRGRQGGFYLERIPQNPGQLLQRPDGSIIDRLAYEHQGQMLVSELVLATRIVPTSARDIWFQSIVDIIEYLKGRIRIAAVVFDRWNSAQPIQQIRSMGIQSYEMTLKVDDFMDFTRMVYNGRVSLLPPHPDDQVSLNAAGALELGKYEEQMEGESVALVEILKLQRSPDLRHVFNPHKGIVRGRNSDDLAHCVVGAHKLVQESIIDRGEDTGRKRELRKKQIASGEVIPRIYRGRKF